MHLRAGLGRVVLLLFSAALLAGCVGAVVPDAAPQAPSASAAPIISATASPTIAPPPTPNAPPGTSQATVDTFQFHSKALEGNLLGDPANRPVQVLLPPGYATSKKRYPVVYYMHGWQGPLSFPMLDRQAELFKTQYRGIQGATGDLVAGVESAMKSGELPEMILVFPNASNMFGGSFYRSSPTIGDYVAYLTAELVALIDARYRTLPRRESRGMTGCSMGGEGAVHLAFRHPEVYTVLVGQSGPYFLERSPFLLGDPASVYAVALAAAVAPDPNKPPLYLQTPWVLEGRTKMLAPGIQDKLKASSTTGDVQFYLAQPLRLNAILLQHGKKEITLAEARAFDKLLTDKGIPHQFDDSFLSHCSYDEFLPMLKFMADHLQGE